MSKLYVFGDSYSTPFICVEPKDSFWGLASKDLGVDKIYNFSFPGNCLDNIIHVILNDTFDFSDSYFLLGIPPINRYSVYTHITKSSIHTNKTIYQFDSQFNTTEWQSSVMSDVSSVTFNEVFVNDKEFVTYFRQEWHDVLTLEKIFLLNEWLISKGARLIVINLSVPLYCQLLWPVASSIMNSVKNLSNTIIFEDTLHSVNLADKIKPKDYDQYGWFGHHGPEGNLNWYNKILYTKMQSLGWL